MDASGGVAAEPGAMPPASFASLARFPPGTLSAAYTDVCGGPWPGTQQLPVVYHPSYNISFFGIEKLHPFDSCKFSKVVAALKKGGVIREGQTVLPAEASQAVLADVHTPDYLYKIHHHNFTVVQVTELAALSMMPNQLLQWRIIAPMRLHVGGTMLAAGLALERGWAINLGGGMHHASADRGMGWCPFDDIALAVRRVRSAAAAAEAAAAEEAAAGPEAAEPEAAAGGSTAGAEAAPAAGEGGAAEAAAAGAGAAAAAKAAAAAGVDVKGGSGRRPLVVLVIDLDAHQGNGLARDKLALPIPDLYILDAYNALIFPRDDDAKPAIDVRVELRPHTPDDVYLGRLEAALLRAAVTLPRPDLVIYNAGTDVLEGDPLGRLDVSPEGVVARDEMVWRWCRDVARAPVAMLLSGGYTAASAGVIVRSIRNLFEKFGLGLGPAADAAAAEGQTGAAAGTGTGAR